MEKYRTIPMNITYNRAGNQPKRKGRFSKVLSALRKFKNTGLYTRGHNNFYLGEKK